MTVYQKATTASLMARFTHAGHTDCGRAHVNHFWPFQGRVLEFVPPAYALLKQPNPETTVAFWWEEEWALKVACGSRHSWPVAPVALVTASLKVSGGGISRLERRASCGRGRAGGGCRARLAISVACRRGDRAAAAAASPRGVRPHVRPHAKPGAAEHGAERGKGRPALAKAHRRPFPPVGGAASCHRPSLAQPNLRSPPGLPRLEWASRAWQLLRNARRRASSTCDETAPSKVFFSLFLSGLWSRLVRISGKGLRPRSSTSHPLPPEGEDGGLLLLLIRKYSRHVGDFNSHWI